MTLKNSNAFVKYTYLNTQMVSANYYFSFYGFLYLQKTQTQNSMSLTRQEQTTTNYNKLFFILK